MKGFAGLALLFCLTSDFAFGQGAVKLPEQKREEQQRKTEAKQQERVAQQGNLEIVGNTAFSEKELRSQLKEQITFIEQNGLTAARADDAAFFLELFYRKHGYAKVNVSYTLHLRESIPPRHRRRAAGPSGRIIFIGNKQVPADKLFDYAVGPTRERSRRSQAHLPFVRPIIEEGAESRASLLRFGGIRRLHGRAAVLTNTRGPIWSMAGSSSTKGGNISSATLTASVRRFTAPRRCAGRSSTLLRRPLHRGRSCRHPAPLQAYYKTRGYYAVKVDAVGDPTLAIDGRVPVRITIDPGPVYYFDGVTVKGTRELRPSYLVNRFRNSAAAPTALRRSIRGSVS